MSPGFLLAAMIVALVTQAIRVATGARGPYAATLALSILGLIGGEVLAGSGHLANPSLGVLHPLADVLVIGITQGAGSLLLTARVR